MSIKLFTKPACMQCNATKKALDRAGLDYEVVDISLDPAAREYVLSLGYMQAPVVEVDAGQNASPAWPARLRKPTSHLKVAL